MPKEIAKPEKQYIFIIPKEGLVYDYRFIKEVSFQPVFVVPIGKKIKILIAKKLKMLFATTIQS